MWRGSMGTHARCPAAASCPAAACTSRPPPSKSGSSFYLSSLSHLVCLAFDELKPTPSSLFALKPLLCSFFVHSFFFFFVRASSSVFVLRRRRRFLLPLFFFFLYSRYQDMFSNHDPDVFGEELVADQRNFCLFSRFMVHVDFRKHRLADALYAEAYRAARELGAATATSNTTTQYFSTPILQLLCSP